MPATRMKQEARNPVWVSLFRVCGPDVATARYLIAIALGGEPTPPGTLSGADVMKKS